MQNNNSNSKKTKHKGRFIEDNGTEKMLNFTLTRDKQQSQRSVETLVQDGQGGSRLLPKAR